MKLRYVLYRLGADPNNVELDEALELSALYTEESSARFCPLLGES
ncbi:MAG: hypothetical protein WCQ59_09635 [Candidatus Cloacimonadaceae bacterium]|jgi:transcription termination factor NusB